MMQLLMLVEPLWFTPDHFPDFPLFFPINPDLSTFLKINPRPWTLDPRPTTGKQRGVEAAAADSGAASVTWLVGSAVIWRERDPDKQVFVGMKETRARERRDSDDQ
eukprot:1118023-Rhodomonas_salina.5